MFRTGIFLLYVSYRKNCQCTWGKYKKKCSEQEYFLYTCLTGRIVNVLGESIGKNFQNASMILVVSNRCKYQCSWRKYEKFSKEERARNDE